MPATYDTGELEGNTFTTGPGEAPIASEYDVAGHEETGTSEMFAADHAADSSWETDPLFSIRPAMAVEQASLTSDEITITFGREPAAVALQSLLGSPQLQQAVVASLLGKAGRRTIHVSGRDIAVSKYLRLLSRLCADAAAQTEQGSASEAEAALSPAAEQESESGTCPGPVTRIISGWGQYVDDVTKLPPAERSKIDELADLIVTSFTREGCVPFRRVMIVGHADRDWHGPKFEMDVSFKRANAVAAALTAAVRALWVARHMGPPPPGGVEWKTIGKGAKQMIAPPYRPANRRVEIVLTAEGPPVPPPPAPDTFERRIGRFLELLKTRRVDPDPTGKRTERALHSREDAQARHPGSVRRRNGQQPADRKAFRRRKSLQLAGQIRSPAFVRGRLAEVSRNRELHPQGPGICADRIG
jgi:outer membrane protein OmpA-like peptidoglycan-associated protein